MDNRPQPDIPFVLYIKTKVIWKKKLRHTSIRTMVSDQVLLSS